MQDFNLFANLKKNLDDFDQNKVVVASSKVGDTARYLNKKQAGYQFSQKEMVNLILLAINSKFQSGEYDSEGQRKVYMNKVRFIRDVSRMRTDIDVKNYVFNPDTSDDYWPAWFMSRRFHIYARENNWGDVTNKLGDDYCTYGWGITKRAGKTIEPVFIKNLYCTQDDSKGLNHAIRTGGYAGEIHTDMSLVEMKTFKDWDTEGLEYDKKYTVYEHHCLVPRSVVDKYNNRKSSRDGEEWVAAKQILIPTVSEKGKEDGKVLFIEELGDESVYEEARWEIVDGRTMPRGPVENMLENQVATNMTANLRRRSLLWSSKHLWQTASEEVAKNLVTDVKDGQILHVGMNGTINPIATESRNSNEYQIDDQAWDKNTQQNSFTFEVATGEALPSGTPFRLGVLLNNAVDSFYKLKQEQFGLFLKRSFFSQMIETFKKDSKAHTLAIAANESGIEYFKKALIEHHTTDRWFNALLSTPLGTPMPNIDEVRQQVTQEAESTPVFFTEVPDKFYDNVKFRMGLDITDEATDTSAEVETLTTLYTTMSQRGDPRADKVLAAILAKTGKNLEVIAGPVDKNQMMQQQMAKQGQMPPQQNAPTIQ